MHDTHLIEWKKWKAGRKNWKNLWKIFVTLEHIFDIYCLGVKIEPHLTTFIIWIELMSQAMHRCSAATPFCYFSLENHCVINYQAIGIDAAARHLCELRNCICRSQPKVKNERVKNRNESQPSQRNANAKWIMVAAKNGKSRYLRWRARALKRERTSRSHVIIAELE